ncbi:MAG: ankyrin repeat domain-containing protein [bacterium]|nr:ankyrin repeat domain-containing protein [bacterium]
MKILKALLAVGSVLAGIVPAGLPLLADESAADERRPFLLGGIQLNENDHQRWSSALHRAGMNAVEVTVYAHQGAWNSPDLWFADEEPAVLAEIRTARENGLQVVLILRVALDHNDPANRFLWHGLVFPETEDELAAWFERYGAFIAKWARIAEAEGVEVLGLASEMNALLATLPVSEIPELPDYYLDEAKQQELRQLVGRNLHLFGDDDKAAIGAEGFDSLDDFLRQRNRQERSWARVFTFVGEDDASAQALESVAKRVVRINRRRALLTRHWQGLIEEVRGSYGGLLTLAANFDNYHEVAFWDRLDLIGVNAYFKLRESLDTPLGEAELAASWRRVFDEIEAFRSEHDLVQPVVFTELGYTRRRGVTVAPWSSGGFLPMWHEDGDWVLLWSAQPFDPAERALAVRGLFSAWRQDRLPLAGILYWKLSSRLELQRYEPFMVYLGSEAGDPIFDALTLFADHIRPLSVPGEGVYSRWFDAVSRGDLDAVARLGASGADVPVPEGRPPLLHLAVRLGHGAMARHLVERGAGTGARDAAGFLPLHWSCYQDDPSLTPALLPPDTVSWRDARGETPFMKCARLDNVPVMRELLHHAGGRDESPGPALRLAIDQASVEMVELLVAAGAGVDAAAGDGVTPLHLAARRGEPAIVELLAAAAKPDTDVNGNRPAGYAAYYGNADAFRLLWHPGAPREANAQGQTLLHQAAHGGSVEILSSLLRQGLRVNLADDDGRTPLHHAVMKTHREAARVLLAHGADADCADAEGATAVHLSAESRGAELLRLVLERAPAVERVDALGNTPLHYAAAWGRLENVRLLLAAGAAPSPRNGRGQTPLEVAEGSGRKRVVELLRQRTPAVQPVPASR